MQLAAADTRPAAAPGLLLQIASAASDNPCATAALSREAAAIGLLTFWRTVSSFPSVQAPTSMSLALRRVFSSCSALDPVDAACFACFTSSSLASSSLRKIICAFICSPAISAMPRSFSARISAHSFIICWLSLWAAWSWLFNASTSPGGTPGGGGISAASLFASSAKCWAMKRYGLSGHSLIKPVRMPCKKAGMLCFSMYEFVLTDMLFFFSACTKSCFAKSWDTGCTLKVTSMAELGSIVVMPGSFFGCPSARHCSPSFAWQIVRVVPTRS
mmetsp:Transcript_41294/g.75343  ORF Transcript_41294/g.75343 Transcript_41294/m.75343 type:complete len:273 (+) Transcript_41294:2290-3108(+)